MKTEREWMDTVAERVRAVGNSPLPHDDALGLVEQALVEHPLSVRLWNIRGDLIQMGEGEGYSLQDALTSYERAIDLDPQDAEAYESIGYFFDAVEDRVAKAEPMFRKAVALGAKASAWAALARRSGALPAARQEPHQGRHRPIHNNKLGVSGDYYNYDRPHGGLGGHTPCERLLAKTRAEVSPGSQDPDT